MGSSRSRPSLSTGKVGAGGEVGGVEIVDSDARERASMTRGDN